MASNSNTNEKTERYSSQMAKEHLGHFPEGQSNKWRGQSQKWTTQYGRHTQWKKTPLRRLGHVIRMDHQHIPRQALHWEVPGFKRGPGRPCTNWRSTVNKDLWRMGITWEGVEVSAQNRSEWCPIHPLGCGLNQGQGEGQLYNTIHYTNHILYSTM